MTSNLEIRDSLFDPDTKGRGAERKGHLSRVFLFLSGQRLPFVQGVTYFLPSSFDQTVRTVLRRPMNPHCKLEIWVSKTFTLTAIVTYKSGEQLRLRHSVRHNLVFARSAPEIGPIGDDKIKQYSIKEVPLKRVKS
jgi:hypothetical protein